MVRRSDVPSLSLLFLVPFSGLPKGTYSRSSCRKNRLGFLSLFALWNLKAAGMFLLFMCLGSPLWVLSISISQGSSIIFDGDSWVFFLLSFDVFPLAGSLQQGPSHPTTVMNVTKGPSTSSLFL